MDTTPQDHSPPDHDVFIVWAHRDRRWDKKRAKEFKETVASFAYLLDDADRIHVEVDLFHYDERGMDFTRWGPQQVERADSVLMISSDALWERWSGRNPPQEGAGAVRECDALHGLFDRDQQAFQHKVLIVVLPGETDRSVPYELSRIQRHTIDELTFEGLELLLHRLLNKPRYPRPTDKIVPGLPQYHEPDVASPSTEPLPDQRTPEPGESNEIEDRAQRFPGSIGGMPECRLDHLASERTRLRKKKPD